MGRARRQLICLLCFSKLEEICPYLHAGGKESSERERMKVLVEESGIAGGGCQEEEGPRSSLGREQDLVADRGVWLGGTVTEGRSAMLFFMPRMEGVRSLSYLELQWGACRIVAPPSS